jgi:hypothetical protein
LKHGQEVDFCNTFTKIEMTETFFLCYVVTEMALNTVATVSLEDTVAYTDKVGHNSVPESQSSGVEGLNSGTEGSTSVTEKQNSGTEGSKSTTEKHDFDTEVEKVNWKTDNRKSVQWIRKLKSGLDSHASYDKEDRVVVMKLPDFKRKPEEHYTPQQWRFGLHNRDLQASKSVASTTESEALKICLAAACNLKSDRWDEFCDNIVHDPERIVLRSYGLRSSVSNFTKIEVQSLLTLDALTLVLVLSSLALPDSIQEELMKNFMLCLEGGSEIGALLKRGAAYSALRSDLFLCENQIPIVLLERVIRNRYFLQGKNSCSDTFRKNPHEDGTKEYLHMILKHLVSKMCTDIFVHPCEDFHSEIVSKFLGDHYHVGCFDDCAHIFACVYNILTFKKSSPATKSRPHEDETKESASDGEKRLHARSLGDHSRVLDIPGTLQIDLEQPGDCELQMSTFVEVDVELQPNSEEGEARPRRLRTVPPATDLKKAGISIRPIPGMVAQVQFNRCLYLPMVQLHERTESYFRNLATYEVFDHYDDKRRAFTDYLRLMSDLIKTQEDIEYLIDDCQVIWNFLGTHHNAFEMWHRLQRGLLLPPYSDEYKKKFVDPIEMALIRNPIREIKSTEIYDRYCSKPWLAISVITGAVLLLATLIQTYVAVIGSDKMQPHFPRGG